MTNQVTTSPGCGRRSQTQPDKTVALTALTRPRATLPDETAMHGKEKVYGSIP